MRKWFLLSVLFFGMVGLGVTPSMAQIAAGSQEVELHLGAIIGDDLTDTDISGETPELGDAFAIGVSYTYNLTSNWGIEGRYTFSPNDAEDTPGGDIDLDLHLLDLNGLYYFNPSDPVVVYGTLGVGWAVANLDEDIVGTANGQPVRIEDSNGFTFNAGIGAKYFTPIDHVFLRADARYRYITELVDDQEEQLNTVELTAGIGYSF